MRFPPHTWLLTLSTHTYFSIHNAPPQTEAISSTHVCIAVDTFSKGHASYPPLCGEEFLYKEDGSLLEPTTSNANIDHQLFGDQHERTFFY